MERYCTSLYCIEKFGPSGNFLNSRVKILHSGEYWEYLLGCLKEIFNDMLSYFILIIIAVIH